MCIFHQIRFPDPDGAEMPVAPSLRRRHTTREIQPQRRTPPSSLPASLAASLGLPPRSVSCSPTIRVACLGWLASEGVL